MKISGTKVTPIEFQAVEESSRFPELESKVKQLVDQAFHPLSTQEYFIFTRDSGKGSLVEHLPNPSSLDHVNVARMLDIIRGHMTDTLQECVFEQNDEQLREAVKGMIKDFLEEIRHRNGILDYVVVCDETNNTLCSIDNGELHADLSIRFPRAEGFLHMGGMSCGPNGSKMYE